MSKILRIQYLHNTYNEGVLMDHSGGMAMDVYIKVAV